MVQTRSQRNNNNKGASTQKATTKTRNNAKKRQPAAKPQAKGQPRSTRAKQRENVKKQPPAKPQAKEQPRSTRAERAKQRENVKKQPPAKPQAKEQPRSTRAERAKNARMRRKQYKQAQLPRKPRERKQQEFPVPRVQLHLRVHPPRGLLHPPRGLLHPPRGLLHPPRGLLHPPRGLLHPPRGLLHPPRGLLQPASRPASPAVHRQPEGWYPNKVYGYVSRGLVGSTRIKIFKVFKDSNGRYFYRHNNERVRVRRREVNHNRNAIYDGVNKVDIYPSPHFFKAGHNYRRIYHYRFNKEDYHYYYETKNGKRKRVRVLLTDDNVVHRKPKYSKKPHLVGKVYEEGKWRNAFTRDGTHFYTLVPNENGKYRRRKVDPKDIELVGHRMFGRGFSYTGNFIRLIKGGKPKFVRLYELGSRPPFYIHKVNGRFIQTEVLPGQRIFTGEEVTDVLGEEYDKKHPRHIGYAKVEGKYRKIFQKGDKYAYKTTKTTWVTKNPEEITLLPPDQWKPGSKPPENDDESSEN